VSYNAKSKKLNHEWGYQKRHFLGSHSHGSETKSYSLLET
jgi:hypothetical protein